MGKFHFYVLFMSIGINKLHVCDVQMAPYDCFIGTLRTSSRGARAIFIDAGILRRDHKVDVFHVAFG